MICARDTARPPSNIEPNQTASISTEIREEQQQQLIRAIDPSARPPSARAKQPMHRECADGVPVRVQSSLHPFPPLPARTYGGSTGVELKILPYLGAEVGERRCAGSEQDERRAAVGRAGARSGEAGEVVKTKDRG